MFYPAENHKNNSCCEQTLRYCLYVLINQFGHSGPLFSRRCFCLPVHVCEGGIVCMKISTVVCWSPRYIRPGHFSDCCQSCQKNKWTCEEETGSLHMHIFTGQQARRTTQSWNCSQHFIEIQELVCNKYSVISLEFHTKNEIVIVTELESS